MEMGLLMLQMEHFQVGLLSDIYQYVKMAPLEVGPISFWK